MTAREPRQWNAGDPEPADRPDMRGGYEGLVWAYEGAYAHAPWRRADGIRGSWEHVLHFGAPLVEVVQPALKPREDGQAALAAELAWQIHDFTEDLPWPDCARIAADAARATWDAGTAPASPDLARAAARRAAQAAEEARPGGDTGEFTERNDDPGELRARLVQIVEDGNPLSSAGEVESTVDAILAAGWRPPQADATWLGKVREVLGEPSSRQHLVEVDDDGNEGDCIIECPGCVLDEVRSILSEPSSPLPESETEWGWKPDPDEPDEVICATDEQAARERVSKASYRKLARREVGPWIEVTS